MLSRLHVKLLSRPKIILIIIIFLPQIRGFGPKIRLLFGIKSLHDLVTALSNRTCGVIHPVLYIVKLASAFLLMREIGRAHV